MGCFASFHVLFSAAVVAEEEVDETSALQLRGHELRQLDEEPGEESGGWDPSYFMSIIASGATLKVENNNSGFLTMRGYGVEKTMVMADRPVRKVSEVKTDDLVTKLRAMFSSGSEDFPNAVLSGRVRGGGMKEVALVLVGASYSGEGPSLTLKWRGDDESITEDLEFDFASLVVDSFFCKLIKKGVGRLSCAAEDLAGAGICAAVDVEDGELGFPICEGLLVGVCEEVISKIGEDVVDKISKGRVSVSSACSSIGLGDPCGRRRRR